MKWIEKTVLLALLSVMILSATLYGIWEDKEMLFPLPVIGLYLVLATWAVSRCRSGGVGASGSKRGAEDGRQRTEDGGQGTGGQRTEIRRQSSPLTTQHHNNMTTEPAKPEGRGQKTEDRIQKSSFIIHQSSFFQTPPGGILLLLFWLYGAALIPFSVLPYEAVISTLRFGCYAGVYWAAANILSRLPARKAFWMPLFIALVFIALYSLVQHKVAPSELFGMERYTQYWEDGRAGGTYQCPNHIAHLVQMWVPLCLVFLFLPQFGWFARICFAYGIPLFLVLIYQTQSRAGILGVIAGLGVTVLMLIWRKSRRWFFIALLAAPLLGAGALGGLWAGSAMFRTRMKPVVRFAEQCLSGELKTIKFEDVRPQAWMDTIAMIADRPIIGFGPGNYGLVYEKYRQRVPNLRMEMVHAHNEYLELLAEYGLVGGFLVLGVLLSVCIPVFRLIRTSSRAYHALPAAAFIGALAGTAVHGFFDFELRIFPNALMLALLAGCAVAPLVQQRVEVASQKPASRFLTFGLWLLTSVSLLLAAGWSVQVMSSAWIRARGDRLLERAEIQSAERLFKTAVRMDSKNWKAQLGLGQVYFFNRYGELSPELKREWALKEEAAYAAAYRINPIKEEVVYGLGRVELFLGNRDKGLDYLRQAANYKRFNDFYWRKLGIELRKAGLYDEAQSAFESAQKLDSSNKTVRRNLQWLKDRKSEAGGQKTEAR